jgi:replicative DNA helicase
MKEDKESGFPVKEMGILIIAKNRHGATGNIYFGHNPSLTRIGDYTPPLEWMKQNLERIDTKKLRDKYRN